MLFANLNDIALLSFLNTMKEKISFRQHSLAAPPAKAKYVADFSSKIMDYWVMDLAGLVEAGLCPACTQGIK